MDKHIILLLRSFVAISILLTTMPCSCSQEDSRFSVCSQSLYSCGSLTNISYPFWGQNRPSFCGSRGFELQCLHNRTTSIQVGSQNFTALGINETDLTMRMVRSDIAYDVCAYNISNTSLSGSHFSFLPTVQNLTILYNCSSEVSTVVNNSFTCGNIGANRSAIYGNETLLRQLTNLESCGVRVQVPVLKGIQLVEAEGGGVDALNKALDEGFDVEYSADSSDLCTGCRDSGGLCGSAMNDTSHFSCHCRDGTHASSCSAKKSMSFLFLYFLLE
ncbi:hypothetical protein L6164_005341 [Bauhinia variegata]|uniref:Uncharacterized protein n=1 Tax=Bauhinia variegata TaxID=167791 RepID=A0ACB9PQ12_BAUVA|nr:hypothetical protein L6164_005341 [Bauhinia variegata]